MGTAEQISNEIAGSGGYVINVNLPSWYKEQERPTPKFWDKKENRTITYGVAILTVLIVGIILLKK